EFEIYLDDVDLCVRAWDAGYSVAPCPEAVVEHKFSASMGAGERARRKYFLATRNRFYLLLRNLTPAQFLTPCPGWRSGNCAPSGAPAWKGRAGVPGPMCGRGCRRWLIFPPPGGTAANAGRRAPPP
ncbi:MAG TPA: hypothetical protein P5069_01650, partial [Candidatus Hydrogenedentes bacterium]|nr:hypothetical protein [Candidatus Hydrogenedentota bacterium]